MYTTPLEFTPCFPASAALQNAPALISGSSGVVSVGEGDGVADEVGVGVEVLVGLGLGLGVAVLVGEGDGVAVAVGFGVVTTVAEPGWPLKLSDSTEQSSELLLSALISRESAVRLQRIFT